MPKCLTAVIVVVIVVILVVVVAGIVVTVVAKQIKSDFYQSSELPLSWLIKAQQSGCCAAFPDFPRYTQSRWGGNRQTGNWNKKRRHAGTSFVISALIVNFSKICFSSIRFFVYFESWRKKTILDGGVKDVKWVFF